MKIRYPKYDKKLWNVHPKIIATIESCQTTEQLKNCLNLTKNVPQGQVKLVQELIIYKCYKLYLDSISKQANTLFKMTDC